MSGVWLSTVWIHYPPEIKGPEKERVGEHRVDKGIGHFLPRRRSGR